MMRCYLTAMASLLLCFSSARATTQTRTRSLAVDPKVPILQAPVVSAYNRWTTIRLPEEFTSVLCGNCIDAEEALPEAEMLKDPRLWLLQKDAAGSSLHIRPLHYPSQTLMPGSFSTDLYVVLKGGYQINLQMAVVDIFKGGDSATDTVVTITAPESVLLSGRMREELTKIEQQREERKQQENAEVLAEHLMGMHECREIKWKVPVQADKTVVRLHQLCAISGEKTRAFWVLFSVENLSDARLYLSSAKLSAAGAEVTPTLVGTEHKDVESSEKWLKPPPDEAVPSTAPISPPEDQSDKPTVRVGHAHRFGSPAIKREEATSGIAVTILESKDMVPSEWKLTVVPHSTDRGVVEVKGIRY